MNLKNISLVISLSGILMLLIIINFSEPKTINISSIYMHDINERVKLTGKISSVGIYTNNFTVFTLEDTSGKIQITCQCPKIKAILNKSQGRAEDNNKFEVIGKIIKYNNKKEIQAGLIKRLS